MQACVCVDTTATSEAAIRAGGADVDATSDEAGFEGTTAIFYAIDEENVLAVLALLSASCRLDVRNARGQTPLECVLDVAASPAAAAIATVLCAEMDVRAAVRALAKPFSFKSLLIISPRLMVAIPYSPALANVPVKGTICITK